MNRSVSRRRLLAIAGAAAGLPLVAGPARATPAPLYRWRGTALGAAAEITLAHPDRARAARIVAACLAEIERLERIFSLFRADSELARLNRDGRLALPSLDLVVVLDQARRIGTLTGGAFDVTVQPLWRLYAGHFRSQPGGAGPDPRRIEAARRLVDYRALEIGTRKIAFARPGMAVTLNGIAQGYITDRVAELLRDAGIERVLLDLGEIRGLGTRPWRIGLIDPRAPGQTSGAFDLVDRAVASSGGYGARFDAAGEHHHLFDPATGASAQDVLGATVIAPRAALADALATALCILPAGRAEALLGAVPGAEAWVTDTAGRRRHYEGGRRS